MTEVLRVSNANIIPSFVAADGINRTHQLAAARLAFRGGAARIAEMLLEAVALGGFAGFEDAALRAHVSRANVVPGGQAAERIGFTNRLTASRLDATGSVRFVLTRLFRRREAALGFRRAGGKPVDETVGLLRTLVVPFDITAIRIDLADILAGGNVLARGC